MATKTKTKAKTKTRSAEDVARAAFDALNARDFDALDELWSPDVVNDMIPVRVLRGPGELRAFFRGVFAALPDYRFTIDRVIADERVAVVQWRAEGNFTGEAFQGIDATGAHIQTRGIDVMEAEDGKLLRNTVYYDGAELARQVGILPARDSGADRAMLAGFNALTKVKKAIDSRRESA